VARIAHIAHILVVDDDADLRSSLAEVLHDEGYDVSCAHDGEEALRALGGAAPDAILLDLTMPVMDGWTFRERQRSDPRLARIPTVVISASFTDADSVAGLAAAAFLPKPFDVERLTETLQRVCGAPPGAPDRAPAASPGAERGGQRAGAPPRR
jgi:CheY-like chemotaxis protein